MMPTIAPAGMMKFTSSINSLVAEGLADAHGFDDLLAQTGACGDIDFQFGSPLFAFVAQHGLIGVDTRLALA